MSGSQQLKSSVQKGIHRKLIENFPLIEDYINTILPKKDPFKIIKWFVFFELNISNYVHLIVASNKYITHLMNLEGFFESNILY